MEHHKDERWKPAPGFEDTYEVSDHGRFRSERSGSIIKQNETPRGYRQCGPCVDGKRTNVYTHRLVLKAFINEPPTENHVCNHLDGDPSNNHVSNLEWTTQKGNSDHAWETGLCDHTGEKHGKAKLTEDDVAEARTLYKTGDYSFRQLAKENGVGANTIRSAVRGHTWKCVTNPSPIPAT